MSGLYIHIPFCRSKCAYCDFTSYAGKEELIDAYLDAIRKEAHTYTSGGQHVSQCRSDGLGGFSTLYVGGGTPSLLTVAQLKNLFSFLKQDIIGQDILEETTFEANCESLSEEKLAVLKNSGVNRLSLGLQSAEDRLLRRLGRPADFKHFLWAFEAARKAGFENINIDLMNALPGQSVNDFAQSLEETIKLAPEHVSLYALEVHKGTDLFRQGARENPDIAADMYELAVDRLSRAGYARYEISNFAKPGLESRHNLNYWDQGAYLGLGCAAASYLDGTRWNNTHNLDMYLKTAPVLRENEEKLAGRAKTAERIMLGLRKTRGIELDDDIIIEFNGKIDRLLGLGLIEKTGRAIKIKSGKLYLSNAVFREFI
ncbi:MAG: hypothetical protein A2X34_03150 [Elusimicrobia bacterium GWC2_51_8]|nr:MAG: hypothetical protein A2X33_09580 [Elusimicrobia bacterium GWA2_51_34]OGR58888.1 MAG: hypothetical protein A2X34_03150 [Elusimicrobia bacterium GWC2_51_8]OGR85387.1 MAG: hypothetical protein A2021_09065 [Elusimicrobia bacterium GWF2_52_66]HAF95037.1 coproporphyrinogen III oxidase [Elusimicrobiota bacterium]HCE97946.1 coproporphyrinogen III oxidase [Elusimicrobiota bacterium]